MEKLRKLEFSRKAAKAAKVGEEIERFLRESISTVQFRISSQESRFVEPSPRQINLRDIIHLNRFPVRVDYIDSTH
jgi:hypothetical protein